MSGRVNGLIENSATVQGAEAGTIYDILGRGVARLLFYLNNFLSETVGIFAGRLF